MEIWCVLIDHNNRLLTSPFDVYVNKHISELKRKVKEAKPEDLAHVDADRLTVWQPKERKLFAEEELHLRQLIDTIDFSDGTKISQVISATSVMSLGLDENEILLVQEPQNKRKHEDQHEDVYEQMKKAKLTGNSPSQIGSISEYKSLQKQPEEKLLDDRPNPDKDIPPIALLYPGFGDFLDIYQGRADVSGLSNVKKTELKKMVDRFAEDMCRYYAKEEERRDTGLELIHRIFQCWSGDVPIPKPSPTSIRRYKSDGQISAAHGGAALVAEFKNELTGITSIPEVEAAAYAAQTHKLHMESHQAVFRGWRMPCLGLTVVGCAVTFHAIVAVNHQYRLIPITSTLSCLPGANDNNDRQYLYSAFTAALVLLTRILKDSATYAVAPPPEIPAAHRRFPAISQLSCYGSEGFVTFEIERFHPDRQVYRWLYIAKTPNGEEILIKFTRHYSIELHDFCTAHNRSPPILGFQRLPGGWYGVAMKYLSSAVPLLQAKNLREQGEGWIADLTALVKSFHAEGFVHGDLRDPNIICNGSQLLLIDFDWAGKAGEVSYPVDIDDLNPDLSVGRSSTDTKITAQDDDRILNFTLNKVRLKMAAQ